MEEKLNSRGARIAAIVLTALALASFFTVLFSLNMSMNLNDPDVWWHLKMGDYVMKNHEVPDEDPFAYTSPIPLNRGQLIGLRAHWLGQVIMAAVNEAKGLYGVVVLRNVLIIMPMIIVLLWMVRRNVPPWQAFVAVVLPASMLSIQLFYSFERPQGMSFNLVLVVAILLERVRRTSPHRKFDHSYWALPLVMLLWSNIHAGYVVGAIVILIYMSGLVAYEGLADFWRNRDIKAALMAVYRYVTVDNRRFFIVGTVSLLVMGINPNGYYIFTNYASGILNMFITDLGRYSGAIKADPNWVKSVVLEYKPLYYFYVQLEYHWLLFYWAFTGLTLGVLLVKYWLRRSVDIAEFITVFFVVLFANMYARGIMFSLTIMPLYLAKSLIEMREGGREFRVPYKAILTLAGVLFLAFASYTLKRSPGLMERGVPTGVRYSLCKMGLWTARDPMGRPGECKNILELARMEAERQDRYVTLWYPTYLSRFMLSVKPDPPMYNYYTWGGYMIYALYPDYRVFIDGRAIDNKMVTVADQILKAFPSWKSLLDGGFGINMVAVPVVFRESGHIIPIAVKLIADDDWSLVFLRNNSALFLRTRPIGSRSTPADWDREEVPAYIAKNREIIKKFAIDKRNIYNEILQIEDMFLRGSPGNPTFNVSKADALIGLGRYAEAKQMLERLAAVPGVAERLMSLRAMGY